MSMAQAIVTGVPLVVGAVLALGGGLVLEHLRFRRRRRVAGRLLFDDLFGHLTQVEVDRERDWEPRERDEGDEIEVDLALWIEHRATVAESHNPESFAAVGNAYDLMHRYADEDPACAAEEALRTALSLTGDWAGFSKAEVADKLTPLADILREHETSEVPAEGR